jgi:hypothetical protein
MALREFNDPTPQYRVRQAEDAHGCGASGCRVVGPVFEVEPAEGRSRTFCADCALDWMCR